MSHWLAQESDYKQEATFIPLNQASGLFKETLNHKGSMVTAAQMQLCLAELL